MEIWEQWRLDWRAGDAVRDEGLVEPEGILAYRNLDYKSGPVTKDMVAKSLIEKSIYLETDSTEYINSSKFDIYKTGAINCPTIVSIHGGGWFYGDKELYRFYCMNLAKRGFNVVSLNYRLAPENAFPACIEDICICMNYLRDNKEMLGLDMDNLFLVGDSAGAHLTSFYSVIASSEEYRSKVDYITSDVKPLGIALNCGLYDMRQDFGIIQELPLQKAKLNEEQLRLYYDYYDYIKSDYPATYVMCSVNDDLCPASQVIKNKLESAGANYIYKEYGQENKKSGHVFHVDLKNPEGQLCNDEEADFFKKLCR